MNFDATPSGTESDGRSGIMSVTSSILRGNSFLSDDVENLNEQRTREKSIIISESPPQRAASATTSPERPNSSTVSSSSQAPASPDENLPRHDHAAGVNLTKSEYYTVPSMKELEKLVDRSGDCFVDGFTVGRTGYGSVYWPGETNVAGLNLDELGMDIEFFHFLFIFITLLFSAFSSQGSRSISGRRQETATWHGIE